MGARVRFLTKTPGALWAALLNNTKAALQGAAFSLAALFAQACIRTL